MPFRLFSLIVVLVVAVALVGCRTQSNSPGVAVTSHQEPHSPISHSASPSDSGIWVGVLLDDNDKEWMSVEWTVGELGQFTGMMRRPGNEKREGISPIPMSGAIAKDVIAGTTSDEHGGRNYFDGTVLRNGETLAGTVIIRSGQGKDRVMKIRLERKPL